MSLFMANIRINCIKHPFSERGKKNVRCGQEKICHISGFCPILANYFQKTFLTKHLRFFSQKTDYQKFKQI